jgi:tetratricopeptide (TPR) repeat protein
MAMSLDTIGLVSHFQGELHKAMTLFNQALEINESIDNQRDKAYVLTHLGYVLHDMNHFAEAKFRLNQGFQIRNEIQVEALAIDTMAGLALVASSTNEIDEALDFVAKILTYIKGKGTDGIEQPVLVYLICYQILSAAAKDNLALTTQAQSILNEGYMLLEKRRSLLNDEEMQRRFISQVPFNRELHEAWFQLQDSKAEEPKE